MKSLVITGSARTAVGKKESKQLRRQEKVPCVLYGGKEPVHFTVPEQGLKKLVYTPGVYTVDLSVDGTEYKAAMRDIQFHPVTERMLHLDFVELHPDKAVVMDIPVKITGTAIGVREGGQLHTKVRKLKVRALPANLPDQIELNVEHLTISKSIRVGDVKLKDAEILDAPNNIITAVKTARVFVEETPVVAAVAAEGAAATAVPEGGTPAAPAAEGKAPAAGKEKAPAGKK